VKDSGLYFNPSNLRLTVATINIKDGSFGSGIRGEIPTAGFFDGKHIGVSKINGTIKNLHFIKDTVSANVNLNAQERSGFRLRKLQADYKLTPQKMEFSKLFIKTNRSTLSNYFVMQYKDFKAEMSDYIK